MSETPVADTLPPPSAGSLIRGVVRIFLCDPRFFCLVGAAATIAPLLVDAALEPMVSGAAATADGESAGRFASASRELLVFAFDCLAVFTLSVIGLRATVDCLQDRPIDIRAALSAPRTRLGPLAALAATQALIFGFLFLPWATVDLSALLVGVVVPLLLALVFALAIVWFVAAPVAAIERAPPLAALARSAELTRGRRIAVVLAALPLVIAAIAASTAAGAAPDGLVSSAVFVILSAPLTALESILVGYAYCLLVASRHGADLDGIEQVVG